MTNMAELAARDIAPAPTGEPAGRVAFAELMQRLRDDERHPFISTEEGATLAASALAITARMLESRGNVLSVSHLRALGKVLADFAGYLTGARFGRRAYGLPTGMGKTTATVAFVVALHRLGYRIPISIAASQVQALVEIRKGLMQEGVPAELIGLKHSLLDGALPSTGNGSRLYQLVTHARIRGGTDFELFGQFEGKDRPLCIYDETLWRADTSSIQAKDARSAIAWVAHQSPPARLQAYLQLCDASIARTLKQASKHPTGVSLELPHASEDELQEWTDWIEQGSWADKGIGEDLLHLLELSGEYLRVLRTDQGAGVIAIRQAVPPGLENVAILDASAPIRELAKLDRGIVVVPGFDSSTLKSFAKVDVFQYLSGGGRSTLGQQASRARAAATGLAKEVAAIIEREQSLDADRSFLIFTYKARGRDDPPQRIKQGLRAAGVDLGAVAASGKPRFQFLTWGQHEGLNGFEHYNTVILAGVLQRDHLSLSAAIKGQQNDIGAPAPGDVVRRILETEVAHCVYQAASRGSCRRVNDGLAQEMRLHLIHRSQGLKANLDPVMPHARWHYPEPLFLPKAVATGKGEAMSVRLQNHLATFLPAVERVSSRALKAAMGLSQDTATRDQFTAAVRALRAEHHGWALDGRSVVRST